jgi:peroxiredoxin
MAQLEPHTNAIAQFGANLVYIAAEKREGVWKPAKYLSQYPIAYPFLLDEDRSVTKAYGLYHAFGNDAFRIAHPATLVVDRGGICRYICRGDDQTDRAPIDEVLAAAEKLQSRAASII